MILTEKKIKRWLLQCKWEHWTGSEREESGSIKEMQNASHLLQQLSRFLEFFLIFFASIFFLSFIFIFCLIFIYLDFFLKFSFFIFLSFFCFFLSLHLFFLFIYFTSPSLYAFSIHFFLYILFKKNLPFNLIFWIIFFFFSLFNFVSLLLDSFLFRSFSHNTRKDLSDYMLHALDEIKFQFKSQKVKLLVKSSNIWMF